MTELNLRRTWPEIFKYLRTSPNPLRIIEIINRVRPCCWTFRFTFDNTGRTIVKIDCDRTISNNDARALLDGSLEEIFFADAVSLCQTGKYHTVDTSKLFKNPPHSNQIILHDHLDKKADSLLTLKGFWQSNTIPPELQKNSTVFSYLLENTWLGSSNFEGSQYCIRWIMFATEYIIQPQNRYKNKLGSTANFTIRKDLYDTNRNHIGHATFYTSPVLKKNELYTLFGPVDLEKEDWLITKNKDPHWIVEIGSEALKQTTIRGGHTRKLINQLIDSVENARISITESTLFQEYKQKIESEQHIKSAHNLKIRQERARVGNRVLFKGEPLMLVPSNENEVLLLLAKLEALNALPFHEFFLWEYTPRAGIDAIASYQIREVEAQSMFVPIELEYHFENFDDHGHPYHQVNLVTCWDFRNPDTVSKLHKHNEWLYEYRDDASFFIVVLSRIPDLQIEEN